MKINLQIAGLIFLLLGMTSLVNAGQMTADDVASQVYNRDVGHDMQMLGIMELISSGGHKRQREYMSLRLDSADKRKVLIRFTAPADIAGTAFLVVEDNSSGDTEQHLYLPALKRTRRIVASQQGRKFVNSDFTYENMHRQPLQNWNYQLEDSRAYIGRKCYVLRSTPLPTTDTQYSSTVSLIDAATFMPLKIDFYDDNKQHCKTYQVKKIALIDGKATEMEVVMQDLLSGHVTRLTTRKIRYNCHLSKALFTIRALEQ